MVPTFSYAFGIPPPPNMRPTRNGWNYAESIGPTSGIGLVYDQDTKLIDSDMGAIPTEIVNRPDRIRGNHMLDSFSAVGPLAHELISGQEPMNVFAPLNALAEKNRSVILMGVGLERMTLIHLAERRAGRNLFLRWANGYDKRPMEVEAGGCSDGFGNLKPILFPLMRETRVSQSLWRVFPARAVLEVAERAIRENPVLTHCANSACIRCNDAILGGPIL
jgi:aminoglycoside 3-N-acetyltransferase